MPRTPNERLQKAIESSRLEKPQLMALLGEQQTIPIVAQAIKNLLERFGDDPEVVEGVVHLLSSQSWTRKVMGTVSIAHWAVACLLDCGRPLAVTAANHAIQNWPEEDRDDLEWFIKSARPSTE